MKFVLKPKPRVGEGGMVAGSAKTRTAPPSDATTPLEWSTIVRKHTPVMYAS